MTWRSSELLRGTEVARLDALRAAIWPGTWLRYSCSPDTGRAAQPVLPLPDKIGSWEMREGLTSPH